MALKAQGKSQREARHEATFPLPRESTAAATAKPTTPCGSSP
jgi:hypothetical protein